MKKVFFLLFFIGIFLIPAMADYTVDSVSTSATVADSGKAEVTMTVSLTFDASADSVTIPLPTRTAGGITTGDFRHTTDTTSDGVDVTISRSDGFSGAQTFTVSYTVPTTSGESTLDDNFSLGLLSSRWARDVASCTYSVTLPQSDTTLPTDFTLSPQIISGYHGALSESDAGLTVSGTTFSGSVSGLMAYDSLTFSAELPQGYFYTRLSAIPVLSITWLSLVMLGILVLLIVYWRLALYTPSSPAVPRLLTPEGVAPCQLPMVLDGQTLDIAALILDWGNLGYLTIALNARGSLILTKTMNMGSERSQAERRLFEKIFGNKNRAALTPGRFSQAASAFRSASYRSLARVIFDRKGGNAAIVQTPARFLLALAVAVLAYRLLPEGGGFVVLAILFGIVGLLYSLYLHSALIRFVTLRSVPLPALALFAVMPVLLGLSVLSGAFFEMFFGLGACIFSAAATSSGPRRSQRGIDAITQTRGLRTFYRQAAWGRLQRYQDKNRRFFQNQLPKAVALGVEKRFSERFERLKVPVPDYLSVPGSAVRTAPDLMRQMTPILRRIREAFR